MLNFEIWRIRDFGTEYAGDVMNSFTSPAGLFSESSYTAHLPIIFVLYSGSRREGSKLMNHTRKKLLLAEDEQLLSEAIREMLEFKGFSVSCAENG